MVSSASSIKTDPFAGINEAALDVYETEPLEADHPLTRCAHVVLTPHCADQTPEGNDLLNLGATENSIAFLSGQPQNIVS